MPEAPSLSELTNLHSDSSLGGGQPAFSIDNKELVRGLNDNARFKAENDWRKYTTFLGNLKEVYKDAGEIAGMKIATQDRDALQGELGNVLNEIAKNPENIFSGAGLGKIEGNLAQLRSKATESVQNSVYDMAHREYMERNPELNTPENQKQINGYWQQPLGKRQPYMLTMPTLLNYDALAKGIMDNPTVKAPFATSGLVGDNGQPGNKYIRDLEGTKYNRDAFMRSWMAALGTEQDKYGHSIRGAVQQQFQQLPEDVQKQFGSPDNYFKAVGEMKFNSDKDITHIDKDTLKPNEFAKLAQQFEYDKVLELLKVGRQKDLEMFKFNLDNSPKPEQTKFLLNLTGSVIGNKTGDKFTIDLGKGKYSTEEVINASPEILKMFSKGGKTTVKEGTRLDETTETLTEPGTNPDILTQTADGGIRAIFFSKYDQNDKDVKNGKKQIGETVMTKDGRPVTESASAIPQREVMSILGSKYIEKKNLAGAVNLSDEVLKSYDGNIIKYLDSQKKQEPKTDDKKYNFNAKDKSTYQGRQKGSDGKYYYKGNDNKWYDEKGNPANIE